MEEEVERNREIGACAAEQEIQKIRSGTASEIRGGYGRVFL
jgi:hypothetical protein